MDVTVLVATYGDLSWCDLAHERAVPSAKALGVPVLHFHGQTLHAARNRALTLDTEWVVHLDADDELEPGYFEAMAKGSADLRAPAVRYVRQGVAHSPRVPQVAGHDHACVPDCLLRGNWLVVGALVRTELLRQVGGWRDWPVYEDWDLWLRCHLAGASFEAVPEAVYRAHVRPDSRNRAPAIEFRNHVHHEIVRANGVA